MFKKISRLVFTAAALGALVLSLTANAADAPMMVPPAAPGYAVTTSPAVIAAPGCCQSTGCEPDCCKKVCVATTEMKKHEHRVYDCKCEDFCVKQCSFLSGLFSKGRSGCNACDSCCTECPTCKCKPMVRRYLIVKKCVEERCETKCHVECQCAEPCCPSTGCEGGTVVMPPAGAAMPAIIQPEAPAKGPEAIAPPKEEKPKEEKE